MINRAQDKLSNPFEKWTASVDAKSDRESDTTESSPTSSRDIFVERYAAVILSIWGWISAFGRALFAFTRIVHAAKVTEGECITHAVNVIQYCEHRDKHEFDDECKRYAGRHTEERPESQIPQPLMRAIVSIREYQILTSEVDRPSPTRNKLADFVSYRQQEACSCPPKPATLQEEFSVKDNWEATWRSNIETTRKQ